MQAKIQINRPLNESLTLRVIVTPVCRLRMRLGVALVRMAARVFGCAVDVRLDHTRPLLRGNLSEHEFALREGHCIGSEDEFFEARPYLNIDKYRRVFRAGFERGWDGSKLAAMPAEPCEPNDGDAPEFLRTKGFL